MENLTIMTISDLHVNSYKQTHINDSNFYKRPHSKFADYLIIIHIGVRSIIKEKVLDSKHENAKHFYFVVIDIDDIVFQSSFL